MNIKGILLFMTVLAIAAAVLAASTGRENKTHVAAAKIGAITHDGDSGEDEGCNPDDSPGHEE